MPGSASGLLQPSDHGMVLVQLRILKVKSDVLFSVTDLVSLGSPHQPPPENTFFSSSDQTRGLLSYINSKFPGNASPLVFQAFNGRVCQAPSRGRSGT